MAARVAFTDHAKLRCKQQKIRESEVSALILANVPKTAGQFKWWFDRFSVVVCYYAEHDKYTVVTVVGLKKVQWRARNWNRR